MKFTLRGTMIFGVIFAIVCLSIAIQGFTALGGITDPAQAADAKGFAWFWTFLGTIAGGLTVLSWWLHRTANDGE